MGCDGYILNPFQGVSILFRCHMCSRYVNESVPCEGHQDCITDDGRLMVNLETDNYEDR